MDRAIGVNCGSGTFLTGVQKYFSVHYNLAEHGLGAKTCRTVAGIPSIPVSNDYSEWGNNEDVKVVFSNAEDWSEAQNAVKFVISNKIPIGILDVRASFWTSCESIFNELSELGFKHGYRTVYLLYSSMSFESGFSENRLAFITYRKDKNFNISAPKLPETLQTLFDSIGGSLHAKITKIQPTEEPYSANCSYELEYDEKLVAEQLESGETLLGQARLLKNKLPGGCRAYLKEALLNQEFRDIKRPHWGFRLHYSDAKRIQHLHPKNNRFLTIGELMSICGWDRLPIGQYPIEQISYGTPAPIGEWLALQAKHYLQDSWGSKDWKLTYKAKEKKFVGGSANPLRPKKFIDLIEYRNAVYVREDPKVFPKKNRFESDFIMF